MCIKGKGHPITHLYGYRGEAEVQLQPIRHPALESREWPLPRSGCLTTRTAPVPVLHGAGWASGPVWTARDPIPGLSSPLRDAILTEISRLPLCMIPWSRSATNDLIVILTLSVTLELLFAVAINSGTLELIIIAIIIVTCFGIL